MFSTVCLGNKMTNIFMQKQIFLTETRINGHIDTNLCYCLDLNAVFGQVCGVRLHNLNLFAFPCLILHRQQPYPGSGIAFSQMLS